MRAASWLLPRVQHGCVVWVPSGREFPFAHRVPLPQVWVGDTRLFPVKKWRIDAREALINSKPSAIEPYLAQGVQFVLATDTNDLAKKAEQWEQAGTARRVWSEGKLAAYELLGARCHTR